MVKISYNAQINSKSLNKFFVSEQDNLVNNQSILENNEETLEED